MRSGLPPTRWTMPGEALAWVPGIIDAPEGNCVADSWFRRLAAGSCLWSERRPPDGRTHGQVICHVVRESFLECESYWAGRICKLVACNFTNAKEVAVRRGNENLV